MNANTLKKLSLNQQTLRNLTPGEMKEVAGGFASGISCHFSCPPRFTCPECAPQVLRKEK